MAVCLRNCQNRQMIFLCGFKLAKSSPECVKEMALLNIRLVRIKDPERGLSD